MAKIRVYELARELNIKNKVLLDKLKEMKVVVSSHMSSLEDDVVAIIKAKFFGKKTDAVEVTRVKPTVIRRRKRHAQVQPPESEKAPEEHDDTVKADVGQIQPLKADVDTGDKKPPLKKEDKSAEKAALPEKEEKSSKAQAKTVAEDKPGKPEKISEHRNKKDKPEKSVSEPPPKIADKEAFKDDTKMMSKEKKPEQEKIAKPEKPGIKDQIKKTSDGKVSVKSVKKAVPPEKPAQHVKKSEAKEKPAKNKKPAKTGKPVSDAGEKKKPKDSAKKHEGKKKTGRRRKRVRKETPAKIIKLPSQPVEKPEKDKPVPVKSEEVKPEVQAVSKPKAPVEIPLPAKEKKKKGKKGKAQLGQENKDVKETKWSKKKISFRKKEVIEGEQLYVKRGRGKKRKKGGKVKAVKTQKTQITTPKAIKRRIKIDETIVLSDLAKRMGIKAAEMIKKLMELGVMATVNQTIDFDTAVLVASEFNYEVEKASFEEEAILTSAAPDDDPDKLIERPPVVTIMGHVDHGKTSLLDVIRKTRITAIEAGGITQHIGAYSVSTPNGNITFLDTPGHEAFTSMRARGATVTDIVVLVVAADDGVMPQTIEAINHSKAAKVPIIVAINKMDKAGADPDRVMRELAEHGLIPEEWGGDTIFVKVSAKMNQGIDELLEMILLQTEVLELRANPDKRAKGYVVEAKLDSGRGPVATVLIQDGTLHAGDSVICGIHYGKIRAMINDLNSYIDAAGPSIPVEVLGLSGVPNAGDELIALEDDKTAKQISEHRLQKQRAKELAQTSRLSLEKLFEKMQKGEIKDLNIVLKADVHGSIEAISDALTKLSNDEVNIKIIHAGTGTVTESDISLAAVSDAIIIGFNVRPGPKIQALANDEHVDMRFYNVIYNVIKDVKDAMLGMMESTFEERNLGNAEVRELFHVPKIGTIAGCYVTDGSIQLGKPIRLVRDGVIIHEGKISSLRRFKKDVKEVQTGYECGIGLEGYNDIKVGDVIECYYLEEIKPELE